MNPRCVPSLVLFTLCLLALFFLIGCSPNEDSHSAPASESGEPVTASTQEPEALPAALAVEDLLGTYQSSYMFWQLSLEDEVLHLTFVEYVYIPQHQELSISTDDLQFDQDARQISFSASGRWKEYYVNWVEEEDDKNLHFVLDQDGLHVEDLDADFNYAFVEPFVPVDIQYDIMDLYHCFQDMERYMGVVSGNTPSLSQYWITGDIEVQYNDNLEHNTFYIPITVRYDNSTANGLTRKGTLTITKNGEYYKTEHLMFD